MKDSNRKMLEKSTQNKRKLTLYLAEKIVYGVRFRKYNNSFVVKLGGRLQVILMRLR